MYVGALSTGCRDCKMDGYELESIPFDVSSDGPVSLYRGLSLERGCTVVVKRYYLHHLVVRKDMHSDFHQALKTGMAQTRVDHPNSRKILDMKVDFSNYPEEVNVFHVLEGLDMDLSMEIEERKRAARPFSEAELRSMLAQIASALAFAHSKVKCNQLIAHRDIKPANILKDSQSNHKLCGFDCYYEGRSLEDQASDRCGTLPYMSPQARSVKSGAGESYSPFKADFYSLGLTAVAAASLELLTEPWPLAGLEEKVRQVVQALGYSQELQRLLIWMLSDEEGLRPTMQQVLDAVMLPPPKSSPDIQAAVPVKKEEYKQATALSDYEVGPRIYSNSGTNLSIYEGKRKTTKEPVVIKTYECEHLGSVNEQLKEGVIQARFEHPNVCSLVDIKVSRQTFFYHVHLIVEKLDRNLLEDIERRAKEERPCSEAELGAFLSQVGSALRYGQQKGLAHRDIKPENILLDSDSRYKLCDFGSAWQQHALSVTNSTQGTPPYMCKQVRLSLASEANRYDPFKADIYALGMTTLYLAALAPPFRQRGFAFDNLVNETLGGLRYSEGFKQLLRTMLAEEEADRPDLDAVLSAFALSLPSNRLSLMTWVDLRGSICMLASILSIQSSLGLEPCLSLDTQYQAICLSRANNSPLVTHRYLFKQSLENH